MVTKKAEHIHTNGKTRPVRDEKGHFVGSVSLKKTKERLMKAIDEYKPPTKKPPVKRGVSKSEIVKHDGKTYNITVNTLPPTAVPLTRLTVYRVYNPSAGQGSGYYFVIKPNSQYESSEAVMTLYNPKTDLLALERAIKKYRAERE
jgi:hypothetical protein